MSYLVSNPRERGVTLISLLVGLIVAMIAILGMLTLYRTSVQVTAQSGEYARITGDRSAAMITAHTVLQDIGFGLANPEFGNNNVLQACKSITLSGGDYDLGNCEKADLGEHNILLWRYETLELPSAPATGLCEGLAIDEDSGTLFYLRPQSCGSLNVTTWAEADVAVLFSSPIYRGGRFHKFEITKDGCNPFGISGASGGYEVTLIAHHPTSDDPEDPNAYDPGDDSSFLPFRMQTCLTNLVPPDSSS